MAQRCNLIRNIRIAASAGVGGVALCSAGGSGDDCVVLVAGSSYRLCRGCATGGTGLSFDTCGSTSGIGSNGIPSVVSTQPSTVRICVGITGCILGGLQDRSVLIGQNNRGNRDAMGGKTVGSVGRLVGHGLCAGCFCNNRTAVNAGNIGATRGGVQIACRSIKSTLNDDRCIY